MAWYDVVVVGGGFGGAFCARRLERVLRGRPERVLVVAPENFLLFSPLLPEAASGTLEPRHAVVPLHEMLRRTDTIVGTVTSIDLDQRVATVVDLNGEQHRIEYRILVLSPGSVPTVLPIPGLAQQAVGFKTIADAIWLRNRVLHQLEAAEAAESRQERSRLLTFTFVGGGYAGVEALAELESLAADAARNYRTLRPHDARWVLVEAADTLLPGLDPRLARYTVKVLRRRGIEIHLRTRMESCEGGKVVLSDRRIAPYESGTVVWTAGQRPSSLGRDLGLELDDRGRIVVDAHLRVPGHEDVFALGDAAAVPDPTGGVSPPTAQHALRHGHLVAGNAAATLGVGESKPFTYRNRGLAVTLGNRQGTAQVYGRSFRGFVAWFMGRSYHLVMLPGLSRKARIVMDWTVSLLFPRDVSQLGEAGAPPPLVAADEPRP